MVIKHEISQLLSDLKGATCNGFARFYVNVARRLGGKIADEMVFNKSSFILFRNGCSYF